MKRVTRTPNRFTISIQSLPAKGLVLFCVLLVLGSCQDDFSTIGFKKPISRFKVYYHEFDIPITTVQSDSIRSGLNESTRTLVGNASDLNFGNVTTQVNAQFSPTLLYAPKIDLTNKTDFQLKSLTINFLLDYYVYGDTTDATLKFSLHKIKPAANFSKYLTYYNFSRLEEYETNPYVSTEYAYHQDSIVERRKLLYDKTTGNEKSDTIKFNLPIDDGYAKLLLDTAKAKGVYSWNETTSKWEFDILKTDSVFNLVFPGFVLKANTENNRVLGLRSTVSVMTLKYTYVKDGAIVNGVFYYALRSPTFSEVSYDRSTTVLSGLNQTNAYSDFNASDDYAYLQSGTGIYAKADFSVVRNYFDASPDTILNSVFNSAELMVDVEPDANRHHLNPPSGLYLRVLTQNNKFFRVPFITSSGLYDYRYSSAYYCTSNTEYLDVLTENASSGPVALLYSKQAGTNRQLYSAYVTEFFESFMRPVNGFSSIRYLALLPVDAPFGTSFHGLSFKKDKVKLRVYYTKAL